MNCVASAVDNPAAVYRVQNECFLGGDLVVLYRTVSYVGTTCYY